MEVCQELLLVFTLAVEEAEVKKNNMIKIENLKAQLIKAYKKKLSLKEEITSFGIVIILLLMSFIFGRCADLLFDKISSKLIVHPVEVCLFSGAVDYTECFLKPCKGSNKDCNRKYKTEVFLNRIKENTFIIVDNSKIYLENKFYNKYFCESSNRCMFKRGKYSNDGSIQEFEANNIWKQKKAEETDIVQFQHKRKSSFVNATLKDFNIFLENICTDYKEVSK